MTNTCHLEGEVYLCRWYFLIKSNALLQWTHKSSGMWHRVIGWAFSRCFKGSWFLHIQSSAVQAVCKCLSLETGALGSFTTLCSCSPNDAVSHSSKSSPCCCDFILTAVLPNCHFSEHGYHTYWPEYDVSGIGP